MFYVGPVVLLGHSLVFATQYDFDGLPSFKSTAHELWPTLPICLIKDVNMEPFLLGLYCGQKKQQSLDYFLKDDLQQSALQNV